MNTTSPRDVAIALVAEHFPECQVALLAGSIVRGERHPGSDLDIVIIDEHATPHWETRVVQGWPVELFIFTPATIEAIFALDVRSRWPLHVMLCREGQTLRGDDERVAALKIRAEHIFVGGPAALSAAEIAQKRYELTWLLDDFRDVTASEEFGLLGHDLLLEAADIYLVCHRHWRGRGGKWTLRMLEQADPPMARELIAAFKALHEQQDSLPAILFSQRVLDDLGGRQFENQYDAYRL